MCTQSVNLAVFYKVPNFLYSGAAGKGQNALNSSCAFYRHGMRKCCRYAKNHET